MQAAKELGYYGYDIKPFKKYLTIKSSRDYLHSSEMRVVEVEKPAVSTGEVLVKIKYVGFCGSDLNTFAGLGYASSAGG